MQKSRQEKKASRTALMVAGLTLILAGCGAGSAPAAEGPSERGALATVDAPLRAPSWSEDEGVVFALREDGRELVMLDPNESIDGTRSFLVTLSDELEGVAGENLALERGRSPDFIYLPIPERDRVVVAENDDMLEARSFGAGESPVRVALGGTSIGSNAQTLYALSDDGRTVTVVDLEQPTEVSAEVEVGVSEDVLIEASGEDGFWLAGPEGVALYEGSAPERRGELSLEAGTLAVDAAAPQRAYAGDNVSGRVVVVEPGEGGELQIAAEAELESPAEYLAAQEGRLYAATNEELVVLDSETLEIVETVKFGPILQGENLEGTEPSGLAVGGADVYVTLEGEPYLLIVEKP
ncbi:MAG: hypothetical protein M3N45_08915 [Actinomycetota bacterium]|nr:hypothetical protein [Actinomycetota bacterium]